MAYNDIVLADSPVAYWPLTEVVFSNEYLVDTFIDATGGNDILLGSESFGGFGGGYTLNDVEIGLGGYTTLVQAPTFEGISSLALNSQNFSFTNEFTIECWLQVTTGDPIFAKGASVEGAYSARVFFSADPSFAGIFFSNTYHGQGQGLLCLSSTLQQQPWNHVAIACDRLGNRVRVYINGFIEAETSYASVFGSTNEPVYNEAFPFRIGAESWSNESYGSYSHVAVYDSFLELPQIQKRVFAPIGLPDPPLITKISNNDVYIVRGWSGSSEITNYQYSVNQDPFTPFAPPQAGDILDISSLGLGVGDQIELKTVTSAGTSGPSNVALYPTEYFDDVVADNPIVYWQLNEPIGPTVYDFANINTSDEATYYGNVSFNEEGLLTCLSVNDVAIFFDGQGTSSDSISYIYNPFLDQATTTPSGTNSSGSIEFWIDPPFDWIGYQIGALGPQHKSTIFSNGNMEMLVGSTSQIGERLIIRTFDGDYIADERKILIDQWNHIVITIDEVTLNFELYVNGEKILLGSSYPIDSTLSWFVGASPYVQTLQPAGANPSTLTNIRRAQALRAKVGHFAIYDSILPAVRIRHHYRTGLCYLDAPDAPTITSVSGRQVFFDSPLDSGSAPVSNYSYSIDGAPFVLVDPPDATSPITIDLSGGGSAVKIKAINAFGDSIPSNEAPISPAPDSTIPNSAYNGWASIQILVDNQMPSSAHNGWSVVAETPVDNNMPSSAYNGWSVRGSFVGANPDNSMPSSNYNGWSATSRIVSISPAYGSGLGGDTVTLSGVFVRTVTSVRFAGVLANIVSQNTTTVVVTTPAGIGNAIISVQDAFGPISIVGSNTFKYYAKPSILSINPNNGVPAGNTLVAITGTGLTDVNQVLFGGEAYPGTNINIIDSGSMTVRTPAHPAGTVDVVVKNLVHESDNTPNDNFTFAPNILPTAFFTFTPPTGVSYLTVSFDASGSTDADGTINSWSWDFGDGGTSTSSAPVHTYTSPGTYTISLVVGDNQGDFSTPFTRQIVVLPNNAPTAVATATSPTTGAAPHTVTFSGSGSSDPDGQTLSFAWDFGDGSTGNTSTTFNIYETPGTYEVYLTVTDTGGGSDTTNSPIIITVTPNNPPVAIASATPTSGSASLDVAFSSAGTNDPDGHPLTYLWTFGNGATSNLLNPVYRYTTPGTYYAKLRVTDTGGLWDESDEIEINIDGLNTPPTAVAFASVTEGDAILEVAFDGGNSTDAEGPIRSYVWDYGDGQQGVGPVKIHRYYTPGVYNAVLTVTDQNYATDTASITITVNENLDNLPPIANISAAPASGPAPLTVQFDGSGSYDEDGIVSGVWDFGDGTGSGYSNPRRTYTAPGNYVVSLTVTDVYGATDTATTEIVVTPYVQGPPDIYRMTPSSGPTVGGTAIQIIGENLSGITSFYFKNTETNQIVFGDISRVRIVSNNSITIYSPPGQGICDVVLVTPAGESATGFQTKYSYFVAPTAVITGPSTGQPFQILTWSASSSFSPFGIRSYYWTFGDGTLLEFGDAGSSIEISPSHFYYEVGSYDLILTVVDNRGIEAVATRRINISWPPTGPAPPGLPGPDPPDWDWGPGGGDGGGGSWPPAGPNPPPPVWLNATCEAYTTRFQKQASPAYRESWVINHRSDHVEFIIRVRVLQDFDAYAFYLGALSMTGDGGIPFPPPSQSTAEFGYGYNFRILAASGISLTRQRKDGLWRANILGGEVNEGETFALSIRVDKPFEISYASAGFMNVYGQSISDRTYSYIKTECQIRDDIIPLRKNQHDYWGSRKVGAKGWNGNLRKVGGPP